MGKVLPPWLVFSLTWHRQTEHRGVDYGMRIQFLDVLDNNKVLFDHTIPGGPVPTACGAADGWTVSRNVQFYANESGRVPPDCEDGSARGIKDVRIKLKDFGETVAAKVVLRARGMTLPAVGSRVRVVFVYGDVAAGEAGQCSGVLFRCASRSSGKQIVCH